ncbi:MAG: hypothetical protein AAGA58_10145 [Verrucomicrobiota bacterium]
MTEDSAAPESQAQPLPPQIVIAIDNACPRQEALEEAAALTAQLGGQLSGVFVENARLVRLASMPFAAEVGLASARARELSPEELERSLRSQARSAERSLRLTAERCQIPWNFSVERGSFVGRVVGGAFSTKSRRRPRERARADATNVLFIQRDDCERRTGPAVVIMDPSLRSSQRLFRAMDLAAELNLKELDILIVGEQMEEAHRQRLRVTSTLEREKFSGRVTLIPPSALGELAPYLEENQSATLVLANARRLLDGENLRHIAESLPIPLFLIR